MNDMVEQRASEDESTARTPPRSARSRGRLPRWQQLVLGVAVVLGVAGFALHSMAPEPDSGRPWTTADTAASGTASTPLTTPGMRSFLPAPSPEPETTQPPVGPPGGSQELPFGQQLEDWSPLLMKLGFSFVVGFCLGYALVVFMKITAFVAGSIALVLFGLQYVGIIEVNWPGLAAYYDAFLVWLQPRADSFREFVGSNLPSVGTAALGLLVGIKRK